MLHITDPHAQHMSQTLLHHTSSPSLSLPPFLSLSLFLPPYLSFLFPPLSFSCSSLSLSFPFLTLVLFRLPLRLSAPATFLSLA